MLATGGAMLRASSHLPPLATLSVLTGSPLTSSSTVDKLCFFAPAPAPATLLHKTIKSTSLHFPFYSFNRVAAMMGHIRPKATASFSGGNSSGIAREILVQHLLLKEDDLKLLLELQKRISEGEDLSDLALEYSICPSKEEGGMLGWVRKGQMVPEFEEAAFSAPINKVVRCKTKFGWHLLQVLSEREESKLEDIEPNELHSKLQDPSFLKEAQLIDVREPEEVDQASLPGFQVLPLRQFGSWGPEITTKFDPEKDTYVLCHHGMRSLQVAKWLKTQRLSDQSTAKSEGIDFE
ncbi:rhodanese-like/PpiC domain-containing protein 12, chloroplastic isoform X2 [Diospyros lotus]|uniref:rhodanese-like/PpiC domain-containing protein 12, chloroplastic isoform X2 n=1 Tax=Diospyros lotus TaxID=55363 RepID=UPI0022542498|nr:rhodanese-like/PpiC domain-containing protein 12, chloroplastic isoform X2 [Diospyros lotus]